MERLNFNHFFYFYIVAKEGSVKEASAKLHVSQPTISDQLKLLETYFDSQLFNRKHRRLELTQQGRIALEYAEKAFELSNEVTAKLRNKDSRSKGNLVIGVTHFMSQFLDYGILLPWLNESKTIPKFCEDNRHALLAQLQEGEIDILISNSREPIGYNMKSFKIGSNKTFALCHKSLSSSGSFPKLLNKIPFFQYTKDSPLRYEIDLFFSNHNLSPKVIGEADDSELLELVLEQKNAFIITPEVSKNRICRNSNILVLGELEDLQSNVWALMRKNYNGIGKKLVRKLSKR